MLRYLGTGFPSQYRTHLRYANYRAATVSATDVLTLQLSNCKNPDPSYPTSYTPYVIPLSGTGAGGATGETIYGKWVVLSTRVRVTYANKDNAKYVQLCMLATNDASTSGLVAIEAAGREFATPVLLCQGAGGGEAAKTLVGNYVHSKVIGVPKDSLMKGSEYWGSPAANPTEMVYLYCYANNLDGTNLSGLWSYEVEFDVVFLDKQLEYD